MTTMGSMTGSFLVALACLGLAPAAPAATFTVNAADDRVDAAPGDGICDADAAAPGEQCTLRAAVEEANARPGADTIVIPAGTLRLTIKGSREDGGLTGDLDILDALTVQGAGADITVIDARRAGDRAFDVQPGVAATLSGLTIRNGKSPKGESGGGGIRNRGSLTLTASTIVGCRSADDSGAVDSQAGSIRLTDVILAGNRTHDSGGAIDVDGGTADLIRVLLAFNRAGHEGGALEATGTSVTLTDVTVRDNRARNRGGGLHSEYGASLTLSGCTIRGNRARSGGGIQAGDFGPDTVMVSNTTFSSNRRQNCAGGVTNAGGNTDSDGSCGF